MHPVPTKVMTDWAAVREHVLEHGFMLLRNEGVQYNAGHASLHRYGMGLYKMRDTMGEHIGWAARPLKGKQE